MKATPSEMQALNDARRQLARAYGAFFAGAPIHKDIVDAEQLFINEWVKYYDRILPQLPTMQTNRHH